MTETQRGNSLPGASSPASSRAVEAALARRRQALGLLLVAMAILVLVLLRAPRHWLFPAGWWRF